MVRYRIRFFGSVQGVGFRYTASHAAHMYGITGFVRNEYDGSVTCEVQGHQEEIDQFLRVIESARFIEVTDMEKTRLPEDADERSFEVRY
jgi:acylphosphatase